MDQATGAAKSQYVTVNGETIIPASRRPDGTMRPERRVRAGYIPPEERTTYMSKGKQWRQEADAVKCPGYDDDAGDKGGKSAQLSKSAKKNAARKAKQQADATADSAQGHGQAGAAAAPHVPPEASASSACAAASVGSDLADLSLRERGAETTAAPSSTGAPGEAGAGPAGMPAELKKVRALQKKVRQAQILMERHAGGEALTDEERVKMDKMADWLQEIDVLNASLEGRS